MKYENKIQAFDICNQIAKAEETLSKLANLSLTVAISEDFTINYGRIATIAVNSQEHDLAPLAKEFTDRIKSQLLEKIEVLKSELENL